MTTPLPAPPPGDAHNLIVLDGYLDDQTLPNDLDETPVRFQLVVSPTDDRIDELVLPCTVTNPDLAHAAVHELGASDLLRVTGHLRLPHSPGDGLLLQVLAIHVLDSGVDLNHVVSHDELQPQVLSAYGYLERYTDYQAWNDPDTCLTSLWHESGQWVDSTDDPSTLNDLITAHRRRTASTAAHPPSKRPAPAPQPPTSRRRLPRLHRMRNWLRRTWTNSAEHTRTV